MCRNYDAGECTEEGCTNRITCHDFMDNRCIEHSINGYKLYDEEDDDGVQLQYLPQVQGD